MDERFILMWFYIVFLCLIPITYRALMALEFSNFFKRSSTWQIKFIMAMVSIAFSYIVASAFEEFFSKLISIFSI